ncbi:MULTISPECIES: homoserine O-acetyltransferase MetA [Oceanimonas]|uniref:Homoserine O-succinyltransferase n=1 Tax=Oceanimonas doudoroffii TaxID=84158 RepID=A0A233RCX1_9GAMM|nr:MULTISPECIES: homoserine O-succinyltransferase [Oceanimonas]NHI01126.1 Homoserine O-succinyltransferase [Oceanimonas sp. MB9]OXY81222.1 homoserine O-succinyltransferase [Oceanimonas doudoroffii]
MPIRIPDRLPAANVLSRENIFVMTETRAVNQDIRPMRVLLLNLMPKKIETENQLLRMLSNSPLQIGVDLLRIDNRPSKNTPQSHLEHFYFDFEQIKDQFYDGLIITGAPLGLTDFCDVVYWDKIEQVVEWSKSHVTSTLFLCWAAQAGLKILYGLDKRTRLEKLSGVYEHQNMGQFEPLVRGFDDVFLAPHSRYADFPLDLIREKTNLKVLAGSERVGMYLAVSPDRRQVFVTGHPEYDPDTLHQEYMRDLSVGIEPNMPVNYYPENNPDNAPRATWRSHGHLLFSNWLNYHVYQLTPYDLKTLSAAGDTLTKDWED